MLRAVLDTNVLVAGLLSASGPPDRILDQVGAKAFELVVSRAVFDELDRVLADPYLRDRLSAERIS